MFTRLAYYRRLLQPRYDMPHAFIIGLAFPSSSTSQTSLSSRAPLILRRHASSSSRIPPRSCRPSQTDSSSSSSYRLSMSALAPGIFASLTVAGLGHLLSWSTSFVLTSVPSAIGVGLVARSLLGVPSTMNAGLTFGASSLLQASIVCLGAKLSMLEVANIGLIGVPIALASMTPALLLVPTMASRAGLSRGFGFLIAGSSSVSGLTSIAALGPLLRAKSSDIALAMACTASLGTIGIVGMPLLIQHVLIPTQLLVNSPEHIGVFIGTAMHGTSQALAAASAFAGDDVVRVAALTKLTRNLLLPLVAPLLVWAHSSSTGPAVSSTKAVSVNKFVPWFVAGFTVMALLRSGGEWSADNYGLAYGLVQQDTFECTMDCIGDLGSKVLLVTAMSAFAMKLDLKKLRNTGSRPALVAVFGAFLMSMTGLVSASVLAPLLQQHQEFEHNEAENFTEN